MQRIALIGNPNSGKSALFHTLTGEEVHIGNWPGVTVEKKEGVWAAGEAQVIDLPGIYSFSPYTPEERVATAYILRENPDLLLQIADSTALERSLFLTNQLLELDIPLILVLNMQDLAEKQGIYIENEILSRCLRIPVISVSALDGRGQEGLIQYSRAAMEEPRRGWSVLKRYPIGRKLPQGDRQEKNGLFSALRQWEQGAGLPWEGENAKYRYGFIVDCLNQAAQTEYSPVGNHKKWDRLFLHPVWGIPIFFVIMAFLFHITFGASFLGTGIPSFGILLRLGMESGMEMVAGLAGSFFQNSPWWWQAFLQEGVFGGLGIAVSFLPQILCLYLGLTFLEDSGYMARGAFLLERPMGFLGLSGKAFLPLLTGFGCSVPAIFAARTLEREESRIITRCIIPFFSCGAKLPLYGFLAGIFFPSKTDVVVFLLYAGGILWVVLLAYAMKKRWYGRTNVPFVMEMPAYHLPRWDNLMHTVSMRSREYLTKAATVILTASVGIWLLSHLSWQGQMVSNPIHSVLAFFGEKLTFLFVPLGFGGGEGGWKAVAAILSGAAAKEAVVSSLVALGGAEGLFTPLSAASFLAFHLLNIPCIAAVSAFWEESGKKKEIVFALGVWFGIAWLTAFAIYQTGCLLGFA